MLHDATLGSEVILNNFRYFNATVNDGQTQTVASGESAAGSTVLGGGTFNVSGFAKGTTLNGGGAVAGLVGIRVGVVSGVINLESSGVEASDWRLRHDQAYHEA